MYTAYWTKAKKYRNLVHWYGILTLVLVDLLLVCIDIPGIIQIEWGNQLIITMIETLVISLIIMGLSIYELKDLNDVLEYTWATKGSKWKVESVYEDPEDSRDVLDKSEREAMMKKVLGTVKGHKGILINNKLDELLDEFGSRKCRSCHDPFWGSTNNEPEADPR